MKFSVEWLKDHLPGLQASPEEIARAVTALGFPLDAAERAGDDTVLTFDITSNRPDAMSHIGLARELAARFGLELKRPEKKYSAAGQVSVTLEAADLCPRYSARLIRGARNGPAPAWMRKRLEALGQRSINGIVDVTNYVLLETGHPLHAFDCARLKEERIVIRRAREGEKLKTLDGQERTLSSSMLVIADAERPVALAGVMGGEDSEVQMHTRDVLLEGAWFEPRSIRRTSKAMDLSTEASLRFEKGMDFEGTLPALDRACELMMEHFGGTLEAQADAVAAPRPAREIVFRYERFLSFMGAMPGMTPEWAADRLRRLGFGVDAPRTGSWRLTAPSFRGDVEGEADVYEELARHYGYDRIEPALPPSVIPSGGLPDETRKIRALRQALSRRGFQEAVTYSMVDPRRETLHSAGPTAAIRNPFSDELAVLRGSLLQGALTVLGNNLRRNAVNPRFFEIGRTFTPESGGKIRETPCLVAVMQGARRPPSADESAPPACDYYDIRGLAEFVFEVYGLRAEFRPLSPGKSAPWHPFRSAEVLLGGVVAGACGQVHPETANAYGLPDAVQCLHLEMPELWKNAWPAVPYQPVSKLSPVRRDLSFLADEALAYAEVDAILASRPWTDVAAIRLLDVYRGGNLPKGKKSLALEIEFQPGERNLREDDMTAVEKEMVELLRSRLGLELRGSLS